MLDFTHYTPCCRTREEISGTQARLYAACARLRRARNCSPEEMAPERIQRAYRKLKDAAVENYSRLIYASLYCGFSAETESALHALKTRIDRQGAELAGILTRPVREGSMEIWAVDSYVLNGDFHALLSPLTAQREKIRARQVPGILVEEGSDSLWDRAYLRRAFPPAAEEEGKGS